MSGSGLCIFVCDSIAQNEQLSLAPGLTGHLCRMFSGKGGKMKKVILVGILIVLGGGLQRKIWTRGSGLCLEKR